VWSSHDALLRKLVVEVGHDVRQAHSFRPSRWRTVLNRTPPPPDSQTVQCIDPEPGLVSERFPPEFPARDRSFGRAPTKLSPNTTCRTIPNCVNPLALGAGQAFIWLDGRRHRKLWVRGIRSGETGPSRMGVSATVRGSGPDLPAVILLNEHFQRPILVVQARLWSVRSSIVARGRKLSPSM